MKTLLLFIFQCCLIYSLNAQVWEATNSPDKVTDFALMGENKIIAAAYGDSAMYYSLNEGQTWTRVPLSFSPSTSSANMASSIHFLDAQNGWAAIRGSGYTQYIFRTTDGGMSWTQIYYGPSASLNKIYFKDALNGWALNGWMKEVWQTTDGGLTWSVAMTATAFGAYPNTIFFLDPSTGWIAGYNCVFRTLDGGQTWTESSPHYSFIDVHFKNALEGYATGFDYGYIYTTNDGGQSWALHYHDNNLPKMTSICFTNAQTGYWSGGYECRYGTCHGSPNILKTTDGGLTWQQMTQPQGWNQASNKQYNKIRFTDGGIGWMNSSDGKMAKLLTTTGLSQVSEEKKCQIYPNPSHHQLFITRKESTSITYYLNNSLGQCIKQGTSQELLITIDLTTLATGMYQLILEEQDHLETHKIIKL